MLVFVTIILLLSSLIVVDESQEAVVKNSKTVNLYKTGIHMVIPLINQITYIYMNERTSRVTMELENGHIELMLSWHVIDPVKYAAIVRESEPFAGKLVNNLNTGLIPIIKTSELENLNSDGFKETSYPFTNLGIVVDKVSILSINESEEINK